MRSESPAAPSEPKSASKRLTPLWQHPFSDLFATGTNSDERRLLLCFLHDGIASTPAALASVSATMRSIAHVGSEFINRVLTTRRISDGRLVLASDLLEGRPLSEAIAKGALRPGRAIAIARQICHGLDAVHRRGITHGLLSPASVILSDREERADAVTLLDFGLAEEVTLDKLGARHTRLQPISPGLLAGDLATPVRDVYLVGAVLYAMLSGHAPFRGRPDEVREGHAKKVPEPPDAPPALQSIVQRCLEKDAALRYGSMIELDAALRTAQETLGLETPWDGLGAVRAASTSKPPAPPRHANKNEIPSGPYHIVNDVGADLALAERSDAFARDRINVELKRSIGTGAAKGRPIPTAPRGPGKDQPGPRIPPPPTIGGAKAKRAASKPPPPADPAGTDGSEVAPAKRATAAAPSAKALPKPGPTSNDRGAAPAEPEAADGGPVAIANDVPPRPPLSKPDSDASAKAPAAESLPETDDGQVDANADKGADKSAAVVAIAGADKSTAGAEREDPVVGGAIERPANRRGWLWVVGGAAAAAVAWVTVGGPSSPSEGVDPSTKAHVAAAGPAFAQRAPASASADPAAAPAANAGITKLAATATPTAEAAGDGPDIMIDDDDPAPDDSADVVDPEPSPAVGTDAEATPPAVPAAADAAPAAARKKRARDAARRGKQALARGDSRSAEQLLRQSLALNSKQPGVAFALGKIRFNAGDQAGAASFFKRAVRGAPRRSEYRIWLGDAYYRNKSYAAARKQYGKAKSLGHAKAAGRLAKVEGK